MNHFKRKSEQNSAKQLHSEMLFRSPSWLRRLSRVWTVAVMLGILQFLLPGLNSAGVVQAATLNGHPVILDSTNKIIPWTADPADGYGQVVTIAWDYFLNRVPNDPATRKPAYFSQSYLNPDSQQVAGWPHNPAGLYAMLIESALKYYAYSGDLAAVQKAEALATHHLDNGMTPSTWVWGGVPYASGDAGSLVYQGAAYGNSSGSGDGRYYLEPDKLGELGYGWLLLYKFSGNTRYRDAAIHAADVLAAKVRTGNASQSPWPFRVQAQTGQIREDYCAHVVSPIELFDELIRLGLGNTAAYQNARQTVWTWLMNYPIRNNVWANYFEDIQIQTGLGNINQLNPLMLARYLMEHPENDANWETHVRGLIAWVESNFAAPQYGANTIKEQNAFVHVMGSHTSRYASINAMLYARTGDSVAKEKAYRAFNWATYMARANGVVIDGPTVNNQWFTDGYGDYIRHFMTGLHAIPEWAPAGETHITGSSSVVKSVSYSPAGVDYVTADTASTDVLRVADVPSRVLVDGQPLSQRSDLTQPGWTFDPTTDVLRVRHDNGTYIQIVFGSIASGSIASPTLSALSVTPVNPSVSIGSPQPFTATGTYADDSTRDLTSQVTWASSNTAVATIASGGLATGVSAGSATLSATLSGVTANTALTVTPVTPATLTITTASLPTATVGVAYSATLAASGGTTPYAWVIDGLLPPGLTLDATTGAITGTPTTAGAFVFTAQVTDSGSTVQSANKLLSIAVAAVATGINLDTVVFKDVRGTAVTPTFSTSGPNELLLAFVASDGPTAGGQTATVSGAGLTWTLVRRTNIRAGTAEVWSALAPTVLSNVTVQSVQSKTTYDQSLTVVALTGASGVGASAGASARSGAPSVSLTTTKANAWVFGVGNDWDNAIGRTLGTAQTLVHQWVDTGVGDTFWAQRLLTGVAAAGTTVTLNDTAPTTDRWNLTAVEVWPK